MSGKKPEISISIVPKDSQNPKADRTNIMAAWRGNDGRLGFMLDRDVVQLAVKKSDGTIVYVRRGGEKNHPDHWINCWEERSQSKPQAAPQQQAMPTGNAVNDDIPF